MKKLQSKFQEFLRDESGASAIEYGLIAALIAIGMLVGLRAVADGNGSAWSTTTGNITDGLNGN